MFSELIDSASGTLSPEHLDQIREFAEYDEMSLALETMVDRFAEQNNKPPEFVIELVRRLAIAMDMEPEFLIRRLKALREQSQD